MCATADRPIPAKRRSCFDASQLEQKGEAAIASGDYRSAEDSLLKAQGARAELPLAALTRARAIIRFFARARF